jgi:Transposase DDE domain
VPQDQSPSSSGSTCPSVEPAKRAASAGADSTQFQKGDSDSANAVYIYPTVTQAQRLFPGLSGSDTRERVANGLLPELRKNADKNAQFGEPTSGQLAAAQRHQAQLTANAKISVEPVYGQIKYNRRTDRFMRRGRAAAQSEWRLVAATHNILKLHSHWIADTA